MLQQQKTEMVPLTDGIAVQMEQFNFLNYLYSNFSQASFINRSPIFYENAASFSLSIRWKLSPLCEKIHLQGWKLKIDKILGLPKEKKKEKKKLIRQIRTGDNTNSSHSSSVKESIIYIYISKWLILQCPIFNPDLERKSAIWLKILRNIHNMTKHKRNICSWRFAL